ncbi:MAG: hypothetical protein ACKVP4_03460 [Hyphomicrobium sp.]
MPGTGSARFVDGVPASVVATAALAWANANCGAELQLKTGAPRVPMDEMLRLAGGFDDSRAHAGLAATCHRARDIASDAVDEVVSSVNGAPRRILDTIALQN